MPKMENATLKQELGRATWKLLHNILARYPDAPTAGQKQLLAQFFDLFVQIYPCGDCATHFQKLLAKFPPQLQNKQTAALWGCHIHNKVNERLNKPIYDCTGILNDYDCGCGGEGDEEGQRGANEDFEQFSSTSSHQNKKTKKDKEQEVPLMGESETETETKSGSSSSEEVLEHLQSIKIESAEGLQRGG